MLTLFYSPGACSLAPHIMLEEAGAPFEAVRVSLPDGAQRTPDYLRINPRGRVPALRDGDFLLTETTAIFSYVGNLYPEAGLLPLGDARGMARLQEMLAYFTVWVHPAVSQIWRSARFAEGAAAQAEVQANGRQNLLGYFDEIEAMARRNPWFLGDRISAADFHPVVFYGWGRRLEIDMGRYLAWSDHMERMLARPAMQRAIAREGLPPTRFQAAQEAA